MPSPSQNFTARFYHAPRGVAFTATDAVVVTTAAVATFLTVGIVAGVGAGLVGLVVAQLVGLAAVPALAAHNRGLPVAGALGLAPPRVASLVGAALIGASFWYLNLRVAAPLVELLERQHEIGELERSLGAERNGLAITLLAVGLVPAICEELVARGVLCRALRPRLGAAGAVLVSALFFGLLHLSLARMWPTTMLGIVLAVIVLLDGSIWPAILAHLLNNAAALLASGGDLPGARLVAIHPDLALGLAAVASLAGLAIVVAGAPRSHRHPS